MEKVKCSICGDLSTLESHHIIPISRGGLDDESNIIDVCSSCHGKIHDVSFSNGRGGLIKEGQEKNKYNIIVSKEYIKKNIYYVADFLSKLKESDEIKFNTIVYLIKNKTFNPFSLFSLVNYGKTKLGIHTMYFDNKEVCNDYYHKTEDIIKLIHLCLKNSFFNGRRLGAKMEDKKFLEKYEKEINIIRDNMDMSLRKLVKEIKLKENIDISTNTINKIKKKLNN